MKKKHKGRKPQDRLMDRLVPVPDHGPLAGVLATTYEFDPEFFETDFLPSLLGLGAWDDRNWTSRIAIERALGGMDTAAVLLDARRYRGRPHSLRVDLTPVALGPGRNLHAKVVLILHQGAVRLLVGSANLNDHGYRHNREVVATLTVAPERPGQARLIAEAASGLRELLDPYLRAGALGLLDQVEQRLSAWNAGPGDPTTALLWGGRPRPLWEEFLARWPGGEPVQRLTIVSPFWSEEQPDGPLTTLLTALREQGCLAPGTELRLLTAAVPDTTTSSRPVLPASFGTYDFSSLGVAASAQAVQPHVLPEEVGRDGITVTRDLHAKLVLFQGPQTSLAYVGSANFSRHGWGFLSSPDQANVEAGLALRRTGAGREALKRLIPPVTGDPVPLTGAAAGGMDPLEQSTDDARWPAFLREVTLAPDPTDTARLEAVVRIEPGLVRGPWSLNLLPEQTGDLGESPLAVSEGQQIQEVFRRPLSASVLERLLKDREVQVRWWESNEGRHFPINVALAARPDLLVGPGAARPGEGLLIAYYQGRVSWEELFPDPEQPLPQEGSLVPRPELEGVDTSQIQAYQVREFVEALKGLREDLKEAAGGTEAAMRLALLGPISPLALARTVADAAAGGQRTATAAGFQLVEILSCLRAARDFALAERQRQTWHGLLDKAETEVGQLLDGLRTAHAEELSGSFRRYELAVRRDLFQGEPG